MSAPTHPAEESDLKRQQLLDDFVAESTPEDREQYRPGSFGCHELLDRTHLAESIIEQFVLTHPSCLANREWYELAERAASSLQALYQQIGAAHLNPEESDSPES